MLPDEASTCRLGVALADALRQVDPPRCVVFLRGDLGAGKTTLVRALLVALGHRGRVPSPTYTLVEPYDLAGRHVRHVDLYRCADPAEIEYLGLRDDDDGRGLLLVEWPEKGEGRLPVADLDLGLSITGDTGRTTRLAAATPGGRQLLAALQFP